MSIKKYTNNAWVDIPYKKYETATDTITTLPKTIIGDGQPISAYTIKGNMTQSGTPTPSNPIYPTECGDKTANLFDGELKQGSVRESSAIGTSYDAVTNYQSTKRVVTQNPVICHGAKVTWNSSQYWICICYFDENLRYIGNNSQGFETWLFNGSHEMHKYPYAAFAVRRTDNADFTPQDASNLNLVVENYKIPISSNGNTYPMYLSEPIRKLTWEAGSAEFVDYVSSTNEHRDINALEFDGSEGWVLQSTNSHGIANFQVTISSANEVYNQNATSVCAYLPQQKQQLIADTTTEGFMWAGYNNLFVRRYASETGTLQAFKDWLAGLKTSGNPFKIIYPLRTPTTESFTAPTIPTSGTAQSFDVDTTLKPSEVSLTYHGWHDSSVKEYDGSDWQ